MLVDKIICLAIRGKMDKVPLLLKIVPKVDAAGRMPEPFTAHNKEEVHMTSAYMEEEFGLWRLIVGNS